MIFFNTTLSSIRCINETRERVSGDATALLSSPWHPPAQASISSIRMSSLKTLNRIKNSIFDDCSYNDGAGAGCGRNLQCNAFSDGNASCEPTENALIKFRLGLNGLTETQELDSIIVSELYQTCGISSRYNNICSQTTKAGTLICTEVAAIVKGARSTKWICLNGNSPLQKRAVPAKLYCYSDCSNISFGQNYKVV